MDRQDLINKIPISVEVDGAGGIERSIRRFKRMCDNFGILREYRRRKEHKKPSVRLKEKSEAAKRRRNKLSSRRR